MTDKRFDSRPKEKHRVRSHSRKTPSGRYALIREYLRKNPGGWTNTWFPVMAPSSMQGDDEIDYITFEDRRLQAEDVLNSGWAAGRITAKDMGEIGPDMETRGFRVNIRFQPGLGKYYKDTIAEFVQEELALKVFGAGNVEIVDFQRPTSDNVEIVFWISPEEL
jgi:hypothetical protein